MVFVPFFASSDPTVNMYIVWVYGGALLVSTTILVWGFVSEMIDRYRY